MSFVFFFGRCSVTKCRSGKEALSLLREDSSRFDIVLSDLHLSDINGLKLLEIMAFEMDMPVVGKLSFSPKPIRS